MRDMTLSPLAIQLGIAAILVLSIAVSTLSFALTSRKAGAGPTIRATSRKLKPGWYQLQIVVTNRAPYGVVVDELRRVRPRAARLMAPIQQVSTREGDFQVWSDPTTDKARIGIPLDIALAPNDGGRPRLARQGRAADGLVVPSRWRRSFRACARAYARRRQRSPARLSFLCRAQSGKCLQA